MCLTIVPKSELSGEQARQLKERLSAPEHQCDRGPPQVWNTYQAGLYGVVDVNSNQVIGIVEASDSKDCVSPGWWLDSRVRGKRYGNKLVDALATYLKQQGYTGVGKIRIETCEHRHDAASQK